MRITTKALYKRAGNNLNWLLYAPVLLYGAFYICMRITMANEIKQNLEIKQIWKPVVGYEGLYEVSNLGTVKSLDNILPHKQGPYLNKGRILKQNKLRNGYLRVTLCNRGNNKHWLVHRIVIKSFIPNLDNKLQVNHINGIKSDNRIENLEWVTQSENAIHSYYVLNQKRSRAWLGKLGKQNPNSKKIGQYTLDLSLIKIWYGAMEISRSLGCNQSNIHACCVGSQKTCYGFIWKYL